MAVSLEPDTLSSTIDAVRENLAQSPEPPIATFEADSALVDGYRTSVTIRQFALTVDEPEKIGGTDTGPTPVELVLAALGTCQEIVYATYSRILGIPIDSVSIHAEGRLDLRGFFGVGEFPAGFSDVSFTIDIASPAPASDIARLVDAVNAHCPVLEILQRPIPVSGSVSLNGSALSA